MSKPQDPTRPPVSPFFCFAVGIAPDEGAERAAIARLQELLERNRWLVGLRWHAAGGLAAATAFARHVLGMPIPAPVLYCLAAAILAYNIALYRLTRPPRRPLDAARDMPRATVLAAGQIVADLVALALFLHFSGGVENPFLFYFVFHMIISSILLSRAASFCIATFAAALFAGLALAERSGVVAHYPIWAFAPPMYRDATYVFGVLVVFVTTVYLAVYLAGDIADRLRARSRELVSMAASLEKGSLQLQDAYEKIAALEARKSDFLRTAAHQLRSPLSAMRSLMDVVIEGFAADPAAQAGMLERARARTDLMIAMVNDLLTLSRLRDAGDVRAPHEERVNGCEIMAELEALYRPRAQAKGVRLEMLAPPASCWILSAGDDLRQVFNNLLDNAILYTPSGGSVTCRGEMDNGVVRISVSDTGIGIAPEDRQRVFEEFYRAPNAKAVSSHGTGLGLAIVKRIVERWHGSIHMTSEAGRGTTFTVEFPAFVEDSQSR